MTDIKKENFYIITYRDPKDGKIVSIKSKTITDSSLGLSFIAISDFIWEGNSALVQLPEEEAQAKRFENVKCLHLSIYCIVFIEEVGAEHKGLKFKKDKSNLLVLPNTSTETKK